VLYYILKYLYLFFLGAALGSFLDVVVTRTHGEEVWWSGRSKCQNCGKTLKWNELIPVLSFVYQKGKCSHCKVQIPVRCFVVELVFGIITVFLEQKFGLNLKFILIELLVLSLFGSFLSDLLYMEIYDLLIFFSAIITVIYQILFGQYPLLSLVYGALFGFSFFAIQYLLTKGKGIGAGDLEIGAVMGLMLGWPMVFVSIMIAYIGGSIISILLIVSKKLNRKSAVPLGVFLIPALIFVFLYSDQIYSFVMDKFYVFSYF